MSEVSVWRDLVTAMLAVYQFSLEKVDRLSEALDAQGLFNPHQLGRYSHEEIFIRLENAGYKRGNLNAIFTERLLALGEHLQQYGVELAQKILSGQDKQAIRDFLQPIKGVGPKVVENYFELRGLNG